MIDLRKEFSAIIRKYGHNVLLQRAKNNGFNSELEKYSVRHIYPRATGLSNIEMLRIEGPVHEIDILYYFQHDARPKERDRIYESDDRYPSGHSVYTIDYALPMRGHGGRVEYWICGSTRVTPS